DAAIYFACPPVRKCRVSASSRCGYSFRTAGATSIPGLQRPCVPESTSPTLTLWPAPPRQLGCVSRVFPFPGPRGLSYALGALASSAHHPAAGRGRGARLRTAAISTGPLLGV